MNAGQRYRRTDKGRATRAAYESGPGRASRTRRERERYRRVLAMIRQIKSVPCADCGGVFDPVCMDFDHRPGEVKRIKLGSASRVKMADVLAEIAKCDVVCANCHRIRTHRKRNHAALCMAGKGKASHVVISNQLRLDEVPCTTTEPSEDISDEIPLPPPPVDGRFDVGGGE